VEEDHHDEEHPDDHLIETPPVEGAHA
jgi:hypothetical protein